MGFNDINLQVSGPQQPASIYKTKVLKGQVPFATQVTEPNTKYVIKHNFVLNGDVTIPANCILEFDGGSISGEHTITGQNTGIEAGLVKIFGTDVAFGGTWKNAFSFIQCGCTTNEEDATTNTTVINKLLSIKTIKDFVLDAIIPINSSINLTRGEFSLKGKKVRTQCGFSVISNNTPCFVYHFANSSSPMSSANLFFDTFCIKYKTWQYDYSDSICFKFTADAHYSWGWLQMYFNNLHIENAYGVVTNLVEPIWDTYWTDIYCYNIAGYFWRTSVLGQLQNVFKNVSVLNYGHRTYTEETKDTNVIGRLIECTGECHFENLDIEDWYGCLFYSPDGITTIINSHFERNYIAGNTSYAISLNGRFTFKNNNVYNQHIAFDVNASIPRSFFQSNSLLKAEIKGNSLNVINDSGAAYGLYNFTADTLKKAKDFIIDTDIFDSLTIGYGVKTTLINHLLINGVKRITTQNFTTSDISNLKIVEKGDVTFYNNLKVYAKYASSTDDTVYQGQSASWGQILNVTSAVASKFKIGEQIKIDGIATIYTITYINVSGDNAVIGLSGSIMSGVQTYNFRHLLPTECLFYEHNNKPISADIQTSGTFANKPVNGVMVGDAYFCTDKQTTEGAADGIMIYYKGSNVWVDALGRVVS